MTASARQIISKKAQPVLTPDERLAIHELLGIAEHIRDDLLTDYIAQHSAAATRRRSHYETALDGAIPKVRALLGRIGG